MSILVVSYRRRAHFDDSSGAKAGSLYIPRPPTFNQFSDDLQTVRRLKRQAGDQKNYELEFELRNLENEMKGLRTDALLNAAMDMPKGGPRTDLIKKIKNLEKTYAQNIYRTRVIFFTPFLDTISLFSRRFFQKFLS